MDTVNKTIKTAQQLIVVLGMHRSGTSVIARGLQVVGVNLGDRLMPAVVDINEKGFWEDLDIVHFNDTLLESCGRIWDSLDALQPVDVEALCEKGFLIRAIELLRKKMAGHARFGFKDPRTVKMLPFWTRVFDAGKFDVRFVLAIRNPLSVIKSLGKRDYFITEKSYYLWQEYLISCLANIGKTATIVVDYDQLMANPESQLKHIADWLGTELDHQDLATYRQEFLEESLQHTRFAQTDINSDSCAPQMVLEIYDFLSKVLTGQTTIDQITESEHLERWEVELNRLRPALRLCDQLCHQVNNFIADVRDREAQIKNCNNILGEREDEIKILNVTVSEQVDLIADLKNKASDFTMRIASLVEQALDREQHIENLGHAITDRINAQIESLNATVSEQLDQISNLEKSAIQSDAKVFNFTRELTARDTHIGSLSKSVSEALAQVVSLSGEVSERNAQIANLDQKLFKQDMHISELGKQVSERELQMAHLGNLVSDRTNTINELLQSSSWKVTAPFRFVRQILKGTQNMTVVKARTPKEAPGPQAFFTICSKNFLAHARVLYNSVMPHYPNAKFYVVLCDRVDGMIDPTKEPFEFIYLEDLDLPNLDEMAARYNITEFNTSVKPFAFLRLMKKFHYESVAYLDPDLFFVDKMVELDQMLQDGAEAILTPHLTKFAEHDEVHDGKMLIYGIYNLGFLALRATPSVLSFLAWWGRRLERECVIRLEDGLFVDQKWADLLPAFVPGARVIHHPGYNVAYWNLPQRKVERRGNSWLVNGEGLRFVHFSGNKLDDRKVFSRHSQQVTMESVGDLRGLLDTYREQVYEQGHAFYRSLPYAFSWEGASGVNEHTPKELDLASSGQTIAKKPESQPSTETAQNVTSDEVVVVSQFRRRVGLLRRAVPVARRISGGWLPLINRAWGAYRRHGWRYVKVKAVELSTHRAPPPAAEKVVRKEHPEAIPSKRLLYMDWAIPKPDTDAASVTAALLMEIVDSLGYKVTFVPCSMKYEAGYYESLVAANIEVLVYPAIESVDGWLKTNARNYDVAILARGPVVWPYLKTLRDYAPNLRLIFNTVDLHYVRELRQAELANDDEARKHALKVRDQEFELIDQCDLTILLSNEELYSIWETRPEAPLAVLPVVFKDIPGSTTSYQDRRDILFIGSFPHQPNIDAVLYFAESVFPTIKKRIPDIRFKIVGSNPPESIRQLAEVPGIEVLGFVKNIEPLFSEIRLSLAPLRYGAGIKGKIGTSLCYGVPCVATPMAVEGMGLIAGKNVMVGETPGQFADAVCELYSDEKLWNAFSVESHRYAQENYSVDVIGARLRNILSAVTEGWKPLHFSMVIESKESYFHHAERMEKEYERRVIYETALVAKNNSPLMKSTGFCCACGCYSVFSTVVPPATGNGWSMPVWKQQLKCEQCGLVSLERAELNLLNTIAAPERDSRIYLTQQTSPTFKWLASRYPNLIGSENSGPDQTAGSVVNGIRHEDLTNLSFADGSFDRMLSLDLVVNVADVNLVFKEAFRVLDNSGVLLFSAPLPNSFNGQASDTAAGVAETTGGMLDWDCLDSLRAVGFKRAYCVAFWSEQQGYLGTEQYLVVAHK